MNLYKYNLILMGLLCQLLTSLASGQQIQSDRGVQVNNLWCFLLLSDSLIYLYLPDDGSRIALSFEVRAEPSKLLLESFKMNFLLIKDKKYSLIKCIIIIF